MSALGSNRLQQDNSPDLSAQTCALKQLTGLGISQLMTLEAIEFQLRELDSILANSRKLHDNYLPLITDLPSSLHACFRVSAVSTKQLSVLVSLIQSAPQALWPLRDDCFNHYEMDFRLAKLQQHLAVLKPLNNKLIPFVATNQLTSSSSLRAVQTCLDSAGLFCWFSASWRKAKNQCLALAVNKQLKLADIKMLLPAIIKYVETMECKDALFSEVPSLRSVNQGINTDLAPLLAIREWYKDVEFVMTEHSVCAVEMLQGLSVIDKHNADKLANDYHAGLLTTINNIDKQMTKLILSFPDYQALQQLDADYVIAVTELKAIILDALSVLKECGIDHNTCLSDLSKQ